MTPEKREIVKRVFDRLVDRDQPYRQRFLTRIKDSEIRTEVARWLANSSSDFQLFPKSLDVRRILDSFLPERAFRIGTVILERFEIRDFLGEGGMGEVYEAFDRTLSEAVAVKTLLRPLRSDPLAVQRFRWEVQRARLVAHPNVCRVHDLFSCADEEGREFPFMTMELLPGCHLFQYVEDQELPRAKRLAIAVQICQGLQAAHDKGLIHRDLKCNNVMLAEDDSGGIRAVITDFGLARPLDAPETGRDGLKLSHVPGTVAYLAPELFDGIAATRRSDIYALGIILFRLATRQLPFSNGAEVTAARAERLHPPNPRDLCPQLEPSWAEAVSACMKPALAARPGSADEVAALLLRPEQPLLSRRKLVAGALSGATAAFAGVLYSRSHAGPRVLEIGSFAGSLGPASVGRTVTNLFHVVLAPSKLVRVAPRSPAQRAGIHTEWNLAGEILASEAGYLIRAIVKNVRWGFRVSVAELTLDSLRDLHTAVLALAIELGLLPPGTPEDPTLQDLKSLDPAAYDDMTAALAEYSAGNLDLALALLDRALARDSEFALAYVYKAIILSVNRRDDLAIEPARRAVQLGDKLSRRVRTHAEAVYSFMTGDYTNALAKYAEVARLSPKEIPLQRHAGQMYTILSRIPEGLAHFKRAVDLEPDNPQNLMLLVSAYADANQPEDAAATFARAEQLIPGSVFLWLAKGYAALQKDRYTECLDAYERAAVRTDLESLARSYQMRALLLGGRLLEAEQRLQLRFGLFQKLEDRPAEDLYRYWAGQLALVRDRPDVARTHAEVLAARDAIPSSLFPLRAAAEIAAELGDSGICGRAAAKAARIDAAYSSRRSEGILLQCRALEKLAEKSLVRAVYLIRQAEEYWTDLSIWFTAGTVFQRQQAYQQALAAYQEVIARKATALRFECVICWVLANGRAGECCEALGNRKQAASYYDKVLTHWGSQKQLAVIGRWAHARSQQTNL